MRSIRQQLILITPFIMHLLVFAILPLLVSPYLHSMLNKVLIFAIFAMSLNLTWDKNKPNAFHSFYTMFMSTVMRGNRSSFFLHFGLREKASRLFL
jgi:hypothetical protein